MKKTIYFENLNAIRFFCFLSVFFFHSFHTEYDYISNSTTYKLLKDDLFQNANLGVNFFFVLSGFLITYLLIDEKNNTGKINIGNFWMRRVLRIWPLYFFCVFFGFVVFPEIKHLFHQSVNTNATPLSYIFFVNNFELIKKGLPDSSVLGVLWSIGVEEQFYLIWPLILYPFSTKKYWILFTVLLIISIVFRFNNNNYMMNEYHSLSCMSDIVIGSFGAWLVHSGHLKEKIQNLSKITIASIYILFILFYFFKHLAFESQPLLQPFERIIFGIIALLIILEQNYATNSFFKLGKLKRISNLGNISYGLYSLHFIGILITINITKIAHFNVHLWQVILIETSLALIITIIISQISFKYYETPFLKLKKKFS